jgi:hypothetical protein
MKTHPQPGYSVIRYVASMCSHIGPHAQEHLISPQTEDPLHPWKPKAYCLYFLYSCITMCHPLHVQVILNHFQLMTE